VEEMTRSNIHLSRKRIENENKPVCKIFQKVKGMSVFDAEHMGKSGRIYNHWTRKRGNPMSGIVTVTG